MIPGFGRKYANRENKGSPKRLKMFFYQADIVFFTAKHAEVKQRDTKGFWMFLYLIDPQFLFPKIIDFDRAKLR